VTTAASWVDLAALAVALVSLVVTISIFLLGKRLSFKQQRERVHELEAKAWDVLGPIRQEGLNSSVIVMNVSRYERGYNGTNRVTWRGSSYSGVEIIEIGHGGIDVIDTVQASFLDDGGAITLKKTRRPGPNVVISGHIPWAWIDDITVDGDDFHNKSILFVQHRGSGRSPYDYLTVREATPVPYGPNDRDYFRPISNLETFRPKVAEAWWQFFQSWRLDRKMHRAERSFNQH